jgi:hypothetical protein
VDRLSSVSRCPHAEQVFELGYQRSMTTRSRPYRSHFVGELAAELAPAAVRDGPGEATVLHHVGDREVFDHDQVVGLDESGAGAVQEVPARVSGLAVGAGNLGRGLGPVRRTFPAAGQPALVAGQVACFAFQVARVGDASRCSRTGGAAPLAAACRGMPGTGTPSSRLQGRTHSRKSAAVKPGVSQYISLGRFTGHQIPPWPGGRSILRRSW